ncbi:hypothetical protein Hneap_1611 [Halothiobacillus neapolitanus c2]|uniref:Uncharacterized protein n=1 Tax=Halothiobacillus neapolitanus (strain ATCC 23641 / DSM 15147 / CIP 104769 / NCIMB 8539 / c2) TaxID=555778 RepID=D0L166_HALNC|nr:hypothetical protein Hneap_1611 [Halothiobacillus neapolitanus c2]TDN66754.1 hypothetical protein C8D83_1011093 [Halothiobacillus neapolitanus]
MSDSKAEFSSEYLPSECELNEERNFDDSFVDEILSFCEKDLIEKNAQRFKRLFK